MTYEPIKVIKENSDDLVIRAGQTASFLFDGEDLSNNNRYKLFFTAEDRMHFALKDEPQTDKLYMLIDDSLDTKNANTRRYCLDLSCDEPKAYPKRAIAKILWPPRIDSIMYGASEKWKFGVYIKAEHLKISDNGFLRICLERWDKKPGVPSALTKNAPDEVTYIDFPEGSYGYTELSKKVEIPDSTACLLVIVEGCGYEGRVYLEEPMLVSSTGKNACPDFDLAVPNLPDFTWVGQNLSKKEWPIFSVKINGREIFRGEKFLRIHRYPSVEIKLPDDLVFKAQNELEITYLSDYHDTVPLSIRECMLLAYKKSPFLVAHAPKVMVEGKDVCVLIRTEEDGITLKNDSPDLEAVTTLCFEKCGLHVAKFRPVNEAHNHTELRLSCGDVTCVTEIKQTSSKRDDGVIVGSADLVYIDCTDIEAVEEYFEWFFQNNLGDLLTIRPVYRWAGHRTLEPHVWQRFCELCRKMGAKYAHMLDGRDLPAMFVNPTPEMLDGEGFLGRQLHERDGQCFYWFYPPFEIKATGDAFWDLANRLSRETPMTAEKSFIAGNTQILDILNRPTPCLYRNVNCSADMKEAYECAMQSLRLLKKEDISRHTGPSVMFKYFYEAGFDWLGMETLDSSMEAPLAFLRGASKAYGKSNIGVHQALQWSTHPHNTEARYRRYLLALYTVYMQGVHQINLEEGYWHFECGFVNHHRFSEACRRHREHGAAFTDFVRSHTRSGSFYTQVAILHGRCDGWNGFARDYVWGMPHMPVGEAEESWSLMKLFYPKNNISGSGMLVPKYPETEADDKPRGMYSGTPRGNVDVIPIECSDFSDYKMLVFLGYNMADPSDFDRLYSYVEKGGMLITAWPHLSEATKLSDIQSHRYKYIDHKLVNSLTNGRAVFENVTYRGKALSVCKNIKDSAEVIERADDGTPIAVRVGIGDGSVILVNAELYPSNEIIKPLYERLIVSFSQRLIDEESCAISCGEDVEYTVYRQANGDYHYYITPVDWYNDPIPERKATLRVGNVSYNLSISFGTLYKIVTNGSVAAWCDGNSAEVISVSDNNVTVQGVDSVTVFVAKDGTIQKHTLDCSVTPKIKLKI